MARANRERRGWILADPRICFDNLEVNDGDTGHTSSYSQTAGRPGTAVAVDPIGTARPHAHHAQANDVSVVALKPGLPVIGFGHDGAGFGYRAAGDGEEAIRGWNDPNLVLGYRPVDWTTTIAWQDVHSVVCPRSQKVVTIARDTGATVDPTVWVWDPSTRTWSVGAEIDPGVFVGTLCSILVQQSTGRLLAIAVDEPTAAGIVYFSDDDAATWAEYSRASITVGNATKIRWVEDGVGNIVLLAVDETTGDYRQLVSTDAGVSFSGVAVDTGTAFGTDLSICRMTNGRLFLSYRFFATGGGFTADHVGRITLDDAFDPIGDQIQATVRGVVMSAAESCVDADGVVYTVMSIDASDRVVLTRSVDGGDSPNYYDYEILATGASTANPNNHRHLIRSVVASGGELIALFNSVHTATTPTTDGSLVSVILGGWSNVEAIGSSRFSRADRMSWIRNTADIGGGRDLDGVFLPTETLANQGWAHTGTAETLVNGYHRFATAAATSFARVDFAGFADDDCAQMYEVGVSAGGDPATDDISILLLRRDGANEKALRLRFYASGFKVLDDDSTSPATLATVVADLTAEIHQFLCLWGTERRVTVLYRRRSSSVWIEAAQAQLGITATATATDQLTVGVTVSSTSDVLMGVIAFAGNPGFLDLALGTGLADDGLFLRHLDYGKSLAPSLPYPVRDQVNADGNMMHLSASGGVARHQERWQIPAEWDHGARDLHPVESPKPTAGWRSLDMAEQIFVWDLGVDTRLGSSWVWGAAFIGANFHQAVVEASTDADPDTWVELGGYVGLTDSGVAFAGVPYTRTGDLVQPDTGAAGTFWYAAGAAVGGHVVLDPTGVPTAKCRRIVWNSSGWVRGSGLKATFRIEGLDGTEPTSGMMHIVARGGVLLMPQEDPPTAYRRYRLRIPEQDTPDGHFRLAKFILGAVTVAGRHWSRGWSYRLIPIVREESDDAGTVYVDARGAEVTGSTIREYTISWQDGYDETKIRAGTADYLSVTASSPPLAADRDVWGQLAGFLRESKGGAIPSVLLLSIPEDEVLILDTSMWSAGRLRGVLQVNNVQGDEGVSTVYRVEQLVHVEQV